jgi:tetratricopeptide (TPR) repeat protein
LYPKKWAGNYVKKSQYASMKPQTTQTKSQDPLTRRINLISVGIFVLFALGVLVYRVQNSLKGTPVLRVEDNLPTSSPPPTAPSKEGQILQNRLQPVLEKGAQLLATEHVPETWATFANEAFNAGETLLAYYALKIAAVGAPSASGRGVPASLLDPMGQCALRLSLYNEAYSLYDSMISNNTMSPEGLLGLSRAQSGLGKNRDAIITLDRLNIAGFQQYVAMRTQLVGEYEQHGQQAQALQLLTQLYSMMPSNANTARRYAFSLYNRQQFAEAQKVLEGLLDIAKNEEEAAPTHTLLGSVLANPLNPKRDPKMAESHLLIAVRQDSEKRAALKRLGELLMQQERHRAAINIYTNLLQIAPNDPAARMQLATAYQRVGDAPTADAQRKLAKPLLEEQRQEEKLNTARNQTPQDPKSHLALGKALFKHGKFVGAFASFQAAYALSKEGTEAETELTNLYKALNLTPPNYKQWRDRSMEHLNSTRKRP